jgi:hypothetical protein
MLLTRNPTGRRYDMDPVPEPTTAGAVKRGCATRTDTYSPDLGGDTNPSPPRLRRDATARARIAEVITLTWKIKNGRPTCTVRARLQSGPRRLTLISKMQVLARCSFFRSLRAAIAREETWQRTRREMEAEA